MYQRDTLSLIVDDAAARLSEEELSERLETQLAGLNDLERESFGCTPRFAFGDDAVREPDRKPDHVRRDCAVLRDLECRVRTQR